MLFIFSWRAGEKQTLACLISMLVGFVFVPIFHEYGHLFFLIINKMDCVYIKCFCFAQYIKDGKKRDILSDIEILDESSSVNDENAEKTPETEL